MDSFKRFLLVHLALGLCSAYLSSARAIYEESPIPEAVLDLLADVELSNVTAVDSLLASCGVDLIPRPKATPAQQAVLKPVIFARKVGNALLGRQCTPTCNPGSSSSDTCKAVNSDCQPGVCCWNGNSGYCCGYGNECDIGGNTGCKWPTTTITVTATAVSTYNQHRTFFTTLVTTEYETETSSSTHWVTLSNVDTATLVQFITVSAQGARRLGRRTNRVHPSITTMTPPPAVHSTTLREFQNHAIENVKSLEGKQPIQTSSGTQDPPKHTTLNAAQKLEKLELLRAKRATDTTVYTDTVTAGTTTRWVTSDSSFTSTISSAETSTYTSTTILISTTVLGAEATVHLTSYFTQRPSASASTAGQDLPKNSQEPQPINNNGGTSLSKGAQAGIAVGSASGSLIICIIIFFVCRRRRGRSKKDDQPPTTSMINSGAAPASLPPPPAEKNYAADHDASVPSTGANSPPSTMEQPGLIYYNSYPSPSHRPPSPATSNSPNPNAATIQDPRAWRGSGGSNEFANPVEAPERHLYGMQHPPTEMPGAAGSFGGTMEQRQPVYAPHSIAPQRMRSPYELPGPEVDGRRGW